MLGQQKASKVIQDPTKLTPIPTTKELQTMEEATYCTIILNLSDSVLRQVIDQDLTYKVWVKLESLYMVKDLPNKT